MECEEDEKLAFLDLLIMKSNDSIELTIYRKPTHSGVFTHFTSFIPHHYKVALVKTLICRAYRHCSSWLLFREEIENVTDMLMNNGYNLSLLENTVKLFLGKCFNDNNNADNTKYGPDRFKVFIIIIIICTLFTKYWNKVCKLPKFTTQVVSQICKKGY